MHPRVTKTMIVAVRRSPALLATVSQDEHEPTADHQLAFRNYWVQTPPGRRILLVRGPQPVHATFALALYVGFDNVATYVAEKHAFEIGPTHTRAFRLFEELHREEITSYPLLVTP
jgi:hypothetical protein